MKKVLACLMAFITSMLFTLQASAAGAVPQTGDGGVWLYVILAVAAAALLVVLLITGKKR